jgi:hypothetical protein
MLMLMLITKTGYGDVFPRTWLGKLITSVGAFAGVGLLLLPASIFAAALIKELDRTKNQQLTRKLNNSHQNESNRDNDMDDEDEGREEEERVKGLFRRGSDLEQPLLSAMLAEPNEMDEITTAATARRMEQSPSSFGRAFLPFGYESSRGNLLVPLTVHESRVSYWRWHIWLLMSGRATRYGRYTRHWPSRIFEGAIVITIMTLVMLSLLSTDPNFVTSSFIDGVTSFHIFAIIFFTLEYSARLWVCVEARRLSEHSLRTERLLTTAERSKMERKKRLIWLRRPLSLLDLLSLLPLYIDIIMYLSGSSSYSRGFGHTHSWLRITMLIHFFRLERQAKSFWFLGNVIRKKRSELLTAVFIASTLFLLVSHSHARPSRR